MATFGQKLRAIRTGNNLTQKDLATIFKVSESAIGMYERDEREPSFKFINDAADRFEVTTDYLLGRTSDTNQGTSKVISKGVKEFLSAIELADDEAILKLKGMLRHEGNELSDDAIREIISYARYKANQE
ncbi:MULTISPECIES: helix-turn-helix domain-containing protein [unclassified Paenibacillus]|uniref:helix-turn-helix domain-containing protein n=1 Tax=unclassified Paenibacillus TaxID=185978 RepID=UPI0008B3DE56|nr:MULTISPECIES: helix-turn-helix transcriptional regulator [unclassified Paenibacillus]QLG37434.1 helix-turn-helix transcriptional regulator [Paenibacillus sp. E222]SEP25995.1 Transcriptional regulator, contains XRE-family HTH domain [Paenibacillus sp. OK076]